MILLDYHIKLEFGTTRSATTATAIAIGANRIFAAGIIKLSLLWVPEDLVGLGYDNTSSGYGKFRRLKTGKIHSTLAIIYI